MKKYALLTVLFVSALSSAAHADERDLPFSYFSEKQAWLNALGTDPVSQIDLGKHESGRPITEPPTDQQFDQLTLGGVRFENVRSYWDKFLYQENQVIRINLPRDTHSAGLVISAFYAKIGTYKIHSRLADGEESTQYVHATGGTQFVGYVSAQSIESIDLSLDSDDLILNEFYLVRSAQPIPGPEKVCNRISWERLEMDRGHSGDELRFQVHADPASVDARCRELGFAGSDFSGTERFSYEEWCQYSNARTSTAAPQGGWTDDNACSESVKTAVCCN